jgi:hypothetical protein
VALDTCNVHHGVKSTGHCHACHKPTCPQCRTRDNCCSDKCAAAKAKFAQTRVPQAASGSWITTLVPIIVLAAIGYWAAKHFGVI